MGHIAVDIRTIGPSLVAGSSLASHTLLTTSGMAVIGDTAMGIVAICLIAITLVVAIRITMVTLESIGIIDQLLTKSLLAHGIGLGSNSLIDRISPLYFKARTYSTDPSILTTSSLDFQILPLGSLFFPSLFIYQACLFTSFLIQV